MEDDNFYKKVELQNNKNQPLQTENGEMAVVIITGT
jgi:hypothetical protein